MNHALSKASQELGVALANLSKKIETIRILYQDPDTGEEMEEIMILSKE